MLYGLAVSCTGYNPKFTNPSKYNICVNLKKVKSSSLFNGVIYTFKQKYGGNNFYKNQTHVNRILMNGHTGG